jgi:hypothetical protein
MASLARRRRVCHMIVRLAFCLAELFWFLATRQLANSLMHCTAIVSVSMTTRKSKSGPNNLTNCSFDHTMRKRPRAAFCIRAVVFKCSHVRFSHTNDSSFVPGDVAMS